MPSCHRDMGANRLIHMICVRVFGCNVCKWGVDLADSTTDRSSDHRPTVRSKPAVDVITRYCCRVLKIRYYYSDNGKKK